MTITYKDNQQLISYNNLKPRITINSTLNSLLSKNDLITVEDAEVSRYEHLKEQTKINGFTAPFFVTGLNNEALLIDGLTRWSIATELVKEGFINPNEALFTVRFYEGFTSLDEIMSWMWDFNQGIRGTIHNPKLNTIMMGIKYNLTKNSQGGDKKSNRQIDGLKNTASEIAPVGSTSERVAEEFSVKARTVERAGKLVRDLHTIANLFNRPSSSLYYLYENGVSQDRIDKLAKIQSGSDDYKKLEKLLEEKDVPSISIFITQEEKARNKEKEYNRKFNKADEAGHIDHLCKLYAKEILTWSNLEQLKKLERRIKDKEWFYSGAKSITAHSNYLQFVLEVNSKYPYVSNSSKKSITRKTVLNLKDTVEEINDELLFTDEEFDNHNVEAVIASEAKSELEIGQELADEIYNLSVRIQGHSFTNDFDKRLNEIYEQLMNYLKVS